MNPSASLSSYLPDCPLDYLFPATSVFHCRDWKWYCTWVKRYTTQRLDRFVIWMFLLSVCIIFPWQDVCCLAPRGSERVAQDGSPFANQLLTCNPCTVSSIHQGSWRMNGLCAKQVGKRDRTPAKRISPQWSWPTLGELSRPFSHI